MIMDRAYEGDEADQYDCLWVRHVHEGLLQAVQAYATDSAGFTRSKVCFSDNWFKSGRWRAYVEDIAKGREEAEVKQAEMLEGLAGWVTDRHPLCRHIIAKQIDGLGLGD